MHICFISYEYPLWATGGIGSFIQTLGRILVKKGHKVTVVGIGEGKHEMTMVDEGVELFRLPAPSVLPKGKFLENAIRIRSKIKQVNRQTQIDVLETPEWGLAFMPQKTTYKKVIRMHGGHHFFAKSENRKINKWKAFQEKRSYANADYLVAVSNFVGQETSRLLGLKKRYEVIYNFVDVNKFSQTKWIETKKGQLLFLGTVCEKKGVGKLIDSLPYIVEKHPDIKLKIVGRDLISRFTGESYTKKMLGQIPDSLKSVVDFIGPVKHNEVPKWISESEIVVLPSFMEAMPIAWLEVLAMGKPLVASNLGPGPEAVTHGETGLLCNPYNPMDIAEKVNFLIENPDKAEKIGNNAHNFALENFNFEKLVDINIDFFERICKERK